MNEIAALDAVFSSTQTPGAVAGCPLAKPPRLPCNLQTLKLHRTAPAKPDSLYAEAEVRWRKFVQLGVPGRSQINAQSPLQVIAPASWGMNKPREVEITVEADGVCEHHPQLFVSVESPVLLGTTRRLSLYRKSVWDDNVLGAGGFIRLLRLLFDEAAERHEVAAYSCGIPASDTAAVTTMDSAIEVFPADQFELMLRLPAFPNVVEYKRRAGHWKTEEFIAEQAADKADKARERKDDRAVAAAKLRVEKGFEKLSNGDKQLWGSRKEFRQFAEEVTRKQLDRKAKAAGARTSAERAEKAFDEHLDELVVAFSVSNGGRSREIDCADVIRLYRTIRSAEALFSEMTSWFNDLQVGVGAGLECSVSMFEIALGAKWGYRESENDRRVFLGVDGVFEANVITLKLKGELGLKLASAADALISLEAEGRIGVSGKVVLNSPEADRSESTLTPHGSLKITGGISGQAGWQFFAVSRLYTLTFSVDCADASMFGKDGLSGPVKLGHSALTYTYSVSLAGYDFYSGDGESVLADQPELLVLGLDGWDMKWNGFKVRG